MAQDLYQGMRGPRNFRQGGSRSVYHNRNSDNVFLVLFSIPPLILQDANGLFQRKIYFSEIPEGLKHFFHGGGIQLLLGGSNCLFPIESHLICAFFRGVWASCQPLLISVYNIDQLDAVTKVRYEKKLSILTPTPPPPWVSLNVYMVSGKTAIVARPGSKLFFQVLLTLGQIHCILPFALKLYLLCHLLITFANSLDQDQAQHSVQAQSGSKLFDTL